MRKTNLLTLFFVSCLSFLPYSAWAKDSAPAQLRWGVESGMNVVHGFGEGDTRLGFNVGMTGEYGFSKHWFVDASLKLSSQPCGVKGTVQYLGETKPVGYNNFNYTPYYLTLPVRVGYGIALSTGLRLTVAAGPVVGLGVFGRGDKTQISWGGERPAIYERKSNSIFNSDQDICFATSRGEYGVVARIAMEAGSHYTLALDYGVMHISGAETGLDNIGLLSINFGYKF